MIFRRETGDLQDVNIFPQRCILHLADCSAFSAYQMKVCFSQCPQFKLHRLNTQLMTHNKTSVYQYFERIVKGGLAYMKVCIFQLLMKRTQIEMSGEVTYTFKYGISFLGPS